jgi:hypothetical protein
MLTLFLLYFMLYCNVNSRYIDRSRDLVAPLLSLLPKSVHRELGSLHDSERN